MAALTRLFPNLPATQRLSALDRGEVPPEPSEDEWMMDWPKDARGRAKSRRELTAEEASHIRSVRPWDRYLNIQRWVAAGHIERSCDRGFHDLFGGPVGTLSAPDGFDTARMVFATSTTEEPPGRVKVDVIAFPFVDTYSANPLAYERHLTGIHGLGGFHPFARVLDWRVVLFFFPEHGRAASGNLTAEQATYLHIARLVEQHLGLGQRVDSRSW